MPGISAVIPVYNGEKFLKTCLDSVLAQTFADFEAIIVDDGSSDGSAAIIDGFVSAHKNFKCIRTENRGVAAARNLGIETAEGKYITFIDSDDLLPPTAFGDLYDAAVKSGAQILIGGNIVFSGKTDKQYRRDKKIEILDKRAALNGCMDDVYYSFVAWGKLFEREFIKDVKFEVGRKINEDSFFVFECFEKCEKAAVIPSVVYFYRFNEKSSSRAPFGEKYFDIIYFAEKKVSIIKKKYPELTERAYNMLVKANMALLDKLCGAEDKKYIVEQKKCREEIKKYKKYYIPKRRRDNFRLFCMLYLFPVYRRIQHSRLGQKN